MHSSLESTGSSIPTFIMKLWKLVADDDTNNFIGWNRNGRSFIIKDQAHFAKEVLPHYFKHNNMASFIRQLNMYGFRKVSNIEHGGLRSDADEVEFFHHNFLQDQEDQLQFIKRKLPNPKSLANIVKAGEIHEILSDVESMRGRQDSVDSMLTNMKRENEALWREVAILRQKHMKQQQIVEKLLHFLVSIVRNQVVGGIKRKTPLMIDASSSNNRKILKQTKDGVCMAPSPGMSGPIISEISDLEENADFSPLMSDASNQLISAFPTNFEISDPKLPKSNEDTSILASSNDNNPLSTMASLPNSILDFDLNDIQQGDDIDSTSEFFDDQLSTGLDTPNISLDESALPFSPSLGIAQKALSDIDVASPSVSTDLVVPSQAPASTSSLPRLSPLSPEYLTINNHIDGIDEELNWLQDQLYGGNLSIDPSAILGIFSHDDQFANIISQEPSTSTMLPKAIMDGSEDSNNEIIKSEGNAGDDDELFEDFGGLNNMASETKDILNSADLDLDPSTFN